MKKMNLQFWMALCFAASMVGVPLSVAAEEGPPPDYAVEVAMISPLANAVTWPSGISGVDTSNICVLGEANVLQAPGWYKEQGRVFSLKLSEHKNLKKALTDCRILFIADSEESKWGEIIESAKGKAILTISNGEGFIERGGMIGFVIRDDKVRFEMNMQAMAASGMKVKADLLDIAVKVIR